MVSVPPLTSTVLPGVGPMVREAATAEPGPICAVLPLLTVAFWATVGGLPNVQFVGVNQLFVPVVGIQTSSCAYKADDPRKRKPSVITIDQQLPHRGPIKNRVEPFTMGSCSKFFAGTATFTFGSVQPCFVRCFLLLVCNM